jgi:flagellar protein FliO/FliZ
MTGDVGDFSWLRLVIAFTVVLALLAVMGFVLKYIAARGFVLPNKAARARRLRIVESMTIDTRRRFVILNCDGREHLLLLGAERDIVIESNLPTPIASGEP